MWRYEPMDLTKLHELLQIYKEIGLMNTEGTSMYGFSFNLNSKGDYTINAMRRLIELKFIFIQRAIYLLVEDNSSKS